MVRAAFHTHFYQLKLFFFLFLYIFYIKVLHRASRLCETDKTDPSSVQTSLRQPPEEEQDGQDRRGDSTHAQVKVSFSVAPYEGKH